MKDCHSPIIKPGLLQGATVLLVRCHLWLTIATHVFVGLLSSKIMKIMVLVVRMVTVRWKYIQIQFPGLANTDCRGLSQCPTVSHPPPRAYHGTTVLGTFHIVNEIVSRVGYTQPFS